MNLDYSSSDDMTGDWAVKEADGEAMVIPWQHLSEDALRGVVEAALLEQVADQNVEHFDLSHEVTRVMAGLAEGEWLLVFDPQTESPALRRPEDGPESVGI